MNYDFFAFLVTLVNYLTSIRYKNKRSVLYLINSYLYIKLGLFPLKLFEFCRSDMNPVS